MPGIEAANAAAITIAGHFWLMGLKLIRNFHR